MDDWKSIISVSRVIELHAEGIKRHGEGALDPPRPDCIDAGLGSAWLAEAYAERPAMVQGFVFAAYAYVYLESRQCFTNGNKRAAWLTMVDILNKIGVDLKCSTQEAVRVCGLITSKAMTADALLRWIVDNAVDMDAQFPDG